MDLRIFWLRVGTFGGLVITVIKRLVSKNAENFLTNPAIIKFSRQYLPRGVGLLAS
jgi:hypothetical protein